MPVHGGDCRNGIADEAHGIVEYISPVLRDLLDVVVVLLTARYRSRAPNHLAILVSQYGFHAGQGLRLRQINLPDARMRVRAAEYTRIEHAGQPDVICVCGLS